ncbi:MAG: SMC-Scp complex subunit ScpB [Patescibacteria group bacterium]
MLKAKLESILFASGKPVPLRHLAKILEVSPAELEKTVTELKSEHNRETSGIHLVDHDDALQFVSSPAHAELLAGLVKDEFQGELTRPQLETLSIICYRGPVTKPEIEQIRGVNCSLIIRNLLIRGLVQEEDDSERLQPVFRVTSDFVRHLGLHELSELPEFERFAKDERISKLMEEATAPALEN